MFSNRSMPIEVGTVIWRPVEFRDAIRFPGRCVRLAECEPTPTDRGSMMFKIAIPGFCINEPELMSGGSSGVVAFMPEPPVCDDWTHVVVTKTLNQAVMIAADPVPLRYYIDWRRAIRDVHADLHHVPVDNMVEVAKAMQHHDLHDGMKRLVVTPDEYRYFNT